MEDNLQKSEVDIQITGLEGPWDEVMKVIGMAHTMLHEKGVMRIQTDIRVGSRYVRLNAYICRVKITDDG